MFNFWKRSHPQRINNDTTFHKLEEHPENVSQEATSPQRLPVVSTIVRDSSQLLRGSKLRFTEDGHYNLDLIKNLIPTPELVAETISLGSLAPKEVLLIYLGNIANPGIIAEIKQRLRTIKARTLYESSYIQRNIEDSTLSPFPQVEVSERPDVAVSALFQGRAVILLDGSPDVLLAPSTFFDLMDTPDDVSSRWFFAASFFKLARYIMLLLAGCLPGFYIALLSYNPEMIPTRLLLLILDSREGTPFPVYFEVFLMMGISEAFRMMLIRMPSLMGSSIALFSGITLLIAGLFTNTIGGGLVIVVTLTVMSSFAIPDYDLRTAIRMIQFLTMIVSSFLGLFGFALAFFLICIHLSTLKSFGIPYMAPLATMEVSAWGHTLLRENSEEMPIDDTYKPQNPLKGKGG
ncbi:spore germination protein [Desulfosporosinus meridiei]|uniref:Spore germination protein, GerA family n=1 Tax=Desulfosporosinus meridiei (strain ATCC BAA-275 / DSM 13257 / KCTC 12902 / NCIMB 13706 / S10) TaxID=768704 RepID=J7IQ10_DESMD|nr:spore germination protein [Desulfosporosinus meridiei]AFQ42249.1 spore germination protein, GerA family [Desulfosporosinus meridiei DSM 13257]